MKKYGGLKRVGNVIHLPSRPVAVENTARTIRSSHEAQAPRTDATYPIRLGWVDTIAMLLQDDTGPHVISTADDEQKYAGIDPLFLKVAQHLLPEDYVPDYDDENFPYLPAELERRMDTYLDQFDRELPVALIEIMTVKQVAFQVARAEAQTQQPPEVPSGQPALDIGHLAVQP